MPRTGKPNSGLTSYVNISFTKAFNLNGLMAIVFMLFAGFNSSFSQTILPTNSSPVGANAAPTGWTIIAGSTDISNKDFWAG